MEPISSTKWDNHDDNNKLDRSFQFNLNRCRIQQQASLFSTKIVKASVKGYVLDTKKVVVYFKVLKQPKLVMAPD